MIAEEYLINSDPTPEELIATTRLTRDLKKSATLLSADQSRYLVDLYYTLQRLRIAAAAQVRSAEDEPNMLIGWTKDMYEKLETDVKGALEQYAKSQIPGQWALSQKGIGPVLAAGLLAHIDITRTPTVSSLWSFAGLNPTSIWLGEKKAQQLVGVMLKDHDEITDEVLLGIAQRSGRSADRLYRTARSESGELTRTQLVSALAKRPWNARLKVLSWKISQSFVKSSSRDGSFYGPIYRERKLYEMEKNERKEYAEQARTILAEKNIGKDTDAYKYYSMGMLPPAHIQARAERYASKLFLSHYWAVCYEVHYQQKPPRPYAIAHLEHTDEIPVPGWPLPGA
jgi:hypothetical protein